MDWRKENVGGQTEKSVPEQRNWQSFMLRFKFNGSTSLPKETSWKKDVKITCYLRFHWFLITNDLVHLTSTENILQKKIHDKFSPAQREKTFCTFFYHLFQDHMHAKGTHLLASPFCGGFLPLMRLARAISLITDILISHCASVSSSSCQQIIWLPHDGILWGAFKPDDANSASASNTCPFLPTDTSSLVQP